MLLTVLKLNSNGLQDAVRTSCILALKYGKISQCIRSHHIGRKQGLPFASDIIFNSKKNLIKSSRFTYKTAPDPDSLESDHSSVTETLNENREEFYKKHNVTIKGKNVPPPILSIEEAGFPSFINEVLHENNVVTPTPIQSVMWPVVKSGRDAVAISPTGSGKTLAFVIPAVMRLKEIMKDEHQRDRSPFGLVLVPTRELAQQVESVFRWFNGPHMRSTAIFGGQGRGIQLSRLSRGVDVIIATPGRCYDFLNSGDITLNKCSFLVLDEADRMLDMGFLPQIEPIIESMSTKRQSLLWSATWPVEVEEIAYKFLNDFVHISVGSLDLKPCENVKQTVVMCEDEREKMSRLTKFLEEVITSQDAKVLIFLKTKSGVDQMTSALRRKGLKALSIHGDKSQSNRDGTIMAFRNGRVNILVATAVASRGLDIDNITHVVNYDCPNESEEYVHKIGRTGRHNKRGEAITYVTPEEDFAHYLIDMLSGSNQEVPRELLTLRRTTQPKRYYNNYNRTRSSFQPMKKRNFGNFFNKPRERRMSDWE